MSNTLYELTERYQQIYQLELDDELFNDTIESLDEALEDKADGYAKVINQLKADEQALSTEIARLKQKKEAVQKKQKQLKEALELAMLTAKKPKFKTALFSFNIQKNPASLKIDEKVFLKSMFADEFLIEQKPKIDTAKVKEALKNGDTLLEGAELVQSESLRIR